MHDRPTPAKHSLSEVFLEVELFGEGHFWISHSLSEMHNYKSITAVCPLAWPLDSAGNLIINFEQAWSRNNYYFLAKSKTLTIKLSRAYESSRNRAHRKYCGRTLFVGARSLPPPLNFGKPFDPLTRSLLVITPFSPPSSIKKEHQRRAIENGLPRLSPSRRRRLPSSRRTSKQRII